MGNSPPSGSLDREPRVSGHCTERHCGKVPTELVTLRSPCFESQRSVWGRVPRMIVPTRIPQTIVISSAVGTTWNTTELSKNEIPLYTTQTSSNQSLLPAIRLLRNEKELDSLCTPIDSSRQSTSLPRQMKPNIQVQQMSENVSCDSSNRSLGDVCEYCVAKF